MADREFLQQLEGHSLTTAEILYRLPDHPAVIQSFIWQEYDIAPEFPRLTGFLSFWSRSIEGPLYRVRVAHKRLISPREMKFHDGEFVLH